MKKALLFLSACIVALASCDSQPASKSATLGSGYEMVVVCDQAKWEGKVGDTLRSFLISSVPMISRKEPLFDLMRVAPSGYDKLILKQRNHLVTLSGERFDHPSMSIEKDKYATGQLVVTVTAPDDASLADFIGSKQDDITDLFMTTERDRRLGVITSKPATAINEAVKAKFGFDISIPAEYAIRNDKPADFMWVSYETHVSQGIIIYSYKADGEEDFSLDSLVAARNRFVGLIPGEVEGSHMTTADVRPAVDTLSAGGRKWVRMSGFWDVAGDFMGGPMRNYTTYDRQGGRMVSIDFYVYSPNIKQRNLLWDTENIIYSVRFPASGDN